MRLPITEKSRFAKRFNESMEKQEEALRLLRILVARQIKKKRKQREATQRFRNKENLNVR